MGAIASQITSLTIIDSIVYSDADQRKHQSSASLAFVQMASYAENVSIWWRHHVFVILKKIFNKDMAQSGWWWLETPQGSGGRFKNT